MNTKNTEPTISIKNQVAFTKINDAAPTPPKEETVTEIGATFEKDGLIYEVIAPVMNKYLENGIYTLEIIIPKGGYVKQHSHQYEHTSILAQGRVDVIADGVKSTLVAPTVLSLKEGVNHEIIAYEDSIWYCIHQTSETDINKVEDSLTLPVK